MHHVSFILIMHVVDMEKAHLESEHVLFFFSKSVYRTWWLTRRLEIATNANINQSPGTDGFTSPPKDVVYTIWCKHLQVNTSSFLG